MSTVLFGALYLPSSQHPFDRASSAMCFLPLFPDAFSPPFREGKTLGEFTQAWQMHKIALISSTLRFLIHRSEISAKCWKWMLFTQPSSALCDSASWELAWEHGAPSGWGCTGSMGLIPRPNISPREEMCPCWVSGYTSQSLHVSSAAKIANSGYFLKHHELCVPQIGPNAAELVHLRPLCCCQQLQRGGEDSASSLGCRSQLLWWHWTWGSRGMSSWVQVSKQKSTCSHHWSCFRKLNRMTKTDKCQRML